MSNENCIELGDYFNDWDNIIMLIQLARETSGMPREKILDSSTISISEIRAARAIRKIRSVEERYAFGSDQASRPEDAGLIQEIVSQPEKINRLNQLAAQANTCENTEIFKRSYRETMFLIFGFARKWNL